jgi:hypothetical protein
VFLSETIVNQAASGVADIRILRARIFGFSGRGYSDSPGADIRILRARIFGFSGANIRILRREYSQFPDAWALFFILSKQRIN